PCPDITTRYSSSRGQHPNVIGGSGLSPNIDWPRDKRPHLRLPIRGLLFVGTTKGGPRPTVGLTKALTPRYLSDKLFVAVSESTLPRLLLGSRADNIRPLRARPSNDRSHARVLPSGWQGPQSEG